MFLTTLLLATAPVPAPAAVLASAPTTAATVSAPTGPSGSTATTNQPVDIGRVGHLHAGQLKERCQSSAPANISYCFGYIVGVYDTVKAYESWLNLREFCVPVTTPQADLRATFVAYINANPGYYAGEAGSVVVVALKERYPCATTGQRKR